MVIVMRIAAACACVASIVYDQLMAQAGWAYKLLGLAIVTMAACGQVKATAIDANTTKPADASTTDTSGSDVPLAAVNGTVLDVVGEPLSGAQVRIGSDVVITGGDGQFQFAAVPPTYDLDVVTPDATGGKVLTGYRALTSRTPEVGVAISGGAQTTSVSGSVVGTTFPLPTGQHIALADTDEYFGFDQPTLPGAEDLTTSSFSGTGVWLVKPTFQGTIWAIQSTKPSNTTTAYNAYSRISTSLTAGTPASITVAMTPLSTATLSGTVSSIPAAAGLATVNIVFKHAADPFGHFVGESVTTTGAFSIATPSGGSISVNVVTESGTSSGGISQSYEVWKANVPSNSTNVSLAIGTAPVFGSPANSSTGVPSNATFSWTPASPAGVHELDITCMSAKYSATIFTTGSSVQLPDTTALGATWPLTSSCTWTVTAFGTTAVDDVVAANGRNKMQEPNGPVDGARVQTTGFGFTTE